MPKKKRAKVPGLRFPTRRGIPDTARGLYAKYVGLKNADGRYVEEWYFVLRDGDPIADRVFLELGARGLLPLPCGGTGPGGIAYEYKGLRRTRDGSIVGGRYGLLLETDERTPLALRLYADACEAEYPSLAADCRELAELFEGREAA